MGRKIRTSVSEIVYTLIPKEYKGYPRFYGNTLQWKLGYLNYEKFTRIYSYEGVTLIVSGVPDKIDYDRGIVHELKVTRNGLKKEQLARAKYQVLLYLWLTGFEKGCIDVYSLKDKKLQVCYEEVKYNQYDIERLLREYIEIKKEEMRRLEELI